MNARDIYMGIKLPKEKIWAAFSKITPKVTSFRHLLNEFQFSEVAYVAKPKTPRHHTQNMVLYSKPISPQDKYFATRGEVGLVYKSRDLLNQFQFSEVARVAEPKTPTHHTQHMVIIYYKQLAIETNIFPCQFG